MPDDEKPIPGWVSNKDLQLELKALRSETNGKFDALRGDFKVWLLGSVAFGQFLSSVDVSPAITGVAVLGVVLKGLLPVIFRA